MTQSKELKITIVMAILSAILAIGVINFFEWGSHHEFKPMVIYFKEI